MIAGCAALPFAAPEEVVRERAQGRWDALVQGEILKAYEYLSPGSRSVMKREEYVQSIRRGFWKAAKVNKVECESREACQVHLTIDYEYQGMRTKTPLRESWIRQGSEWWYVQK